MERGDTDKITRLMDPEIMQYRRNMEKMLNMENTMSNTTLTQLQEGLTTAYIDGTAAANLAYKPAFVSNNPEEGKKVISVIEDELMKCDQFQISVAFITMGGITPLLQTLKELEKRQIPGQILTTNYLNFSEPRALKKLQELSNVTLKMYDVDRADQGFHTKGYIFKKEEIYRIIIGSSNITSAALTKNKEWNTKIVSTEQGEIAMEIVKEFHQLWDSKYALFYDDFYENYKQKYEIIKKQREIAKRDEISSTEKYKLEPNSMQVGFITNLRRIVDAGENRALLISATGTGKTYASAFAMRELGFKRVLFLVHRSTLAKQALTSFRKVFEDKKSMGIVGAGYSDYEADYIFAMVETLHKADNLRKFDPEEFDCIVLDECHRAVTPGTKRELERFFRNSLWYGFTGTPRFAENAYPQMGDLPRTTEELYGKQLHKYTIQNAIHDNAVLGFQVEHNGPKNMADETDSSVYESEAHMLSVLDVILNKSYHKLGFQNGKGKTYEGLLTTSSIQMAQKYYDLLKRVKNGETELQIDERIKQVLPDFPKFAITYSITENEEGSHVNQQKMQESLDDYNEMFGTKYELAQIQGYNGNLNKRLARKDPKFQSRNEQLDLVIVVDRLLTGFDAPCMSTIFIDRQPMGPHDLIQAFSRTNRIYDKNKTYGQIVTFQAPKLFKESVDNAVKLYSAGSTESALVAEWDEIEPAFRKALKALRVSAETPEEIPGMSRKEKIVFIKMFQNFDKLFAQLKSFTQYDDSMLEEYGITQDEYEDYVAHYLNVKEEVQPKPDDPQGGDEEPTINMDYELMAYSHTKIDYEYIINLIQNIVTPSDDEEVAPEQRQKQIEEVKQYIGDLSKENPKVAALMSDLVCDIEVDEDRYKGKSIRNVIENMKHNCIEKVVSEFCITWCASKDDVMYAATHYRNGEIPNENAIKITADFPSYKATQEQAIPKFKYYTMLIADLKKTLDEEVNPLLNN